LLEHSTSVNPDVKSSLKSFVLEVLIYAGLVAAYFFLVLHFLGGWLNELFHDHRHVYAAAALLLIVCQGVLLEWVTSRLLAFIKPRVGDR
jgi:hypothetical protein